MDNNIDSLKIEVSTESKDATSSLEKLKSTLTKIKKASEDSGLAKVKNELKEISALNFSNLNPLLKTLDKLGLKGKKATDEIKKLNDELIRNGSIKVASPESVAEDTTELMKQYQTNPWHFTHHSLSFTVSSPILLIKTVRDGITDTYIHCQITSRKTKRMLQRSFTALPKRRP